MKYIRIFYFIYVLRQQKIYIYFLFRKTDNLIERLDLVITNTTKNKSDIEQYAQKENLKTILWPLSNLEAFEYDLGLIVAFGHMIKGDVLAKFPL